LYDSNNSLDNFDDGIFDDFTVTSGQCLVVKLSASLNIPFANDTSTPPVHAASGGVVTTRMRSLPSTTIFGGMVDYPSLSNAFGNARDRGTSVISRVVASAASRLPSRSKDRHSISNSSSSGTNGSIKGGKNGKGGSLLNGNEKVEFLTMRGPKGKGRAQVAISSYNHQHALLLRQQRIHDNGGHHIVDERLTLGPAHPSNLPTPTTANTNTTSTASSAVATKISTDTKIETNDPNQLPTSTESPTVTSAVTSSSTPSTKQPSAPSSSSSNGVAGKLKAGVGNVGAALSKWWNKPSNDKSTNSSSSPSSSSVASSSKSSSSSNNSTSQLVAQLTYVHIDWFDIINDVILNNTNNTKSKPLASSSSTVPSVSASPSPAPSSPISIKEGEDDKVASVVVGSSLSSSSSMVGSAPIGSLPL
jgi:hypothetical protein